MEVLDSQGKAIKPKEGYEDLETHAGGPEFTRGEDSAVPKDKKGPQGLRSILLKGEMRYLKDVNMLVFLCSPL